MSKKVQTHPNSIADTAPLPDASCAQSDEFNFLHTLIDNLPFQQRIALKAYFGIGNAQTSTVFQIAANTGKERSDIEKWLKEGLETIKSEIKKADKCVRYRLQQTEEETRKHYKPATNIVAFPSKNPAP